MRQVRHKVINAQLENIEKVITDTIGDRITTKDYEELLDSEFKKKGFMLFVHEFGPALTKWLYGHHTYLFQDYMRACGNIYTTMKNYDDNQSSTTVSGAASMLATLVMLEWKDIAKHDYSLLDKSEANRVMTSILKRYLGKEAGDITPAIRSDLRNHFKQYVTEKGRYIYSGNKMIIKVMYQGQRPFYLVK